MGEAAALKRLAGMEAPVEVSRAKGPGGTAQTPRDHARNVFGCGGGGRRKGTTNEDRLESSDCPQTTEKMFRSRSVLGPGTGHFRGGRHRWTASTFPIEGNWEGMVNPFLGFLCSVCLRRAEEEEEEEEDEEDGGVNQIPCLGRRLVMGENGAGDGDGGNEEDPCVWAPEHGRAV